jgi:hypothetical protein
MNEKKAQLIEQARRQYRRIFPCSTNRDLDDCFTIEGSKVLFWFNTDDDSTHMVTSDM